MRLDWNWAFTLAILPELARALRITVAATLVGAALALGLGLALALLRRSSISGLGAATGWVVEFVRNTPLLIQIYVLFYVLPRFGFSMTPFVTGVLALGVHYSAYTSEVYRAGIDSVPRGQWEAAAALNLPRARTFFRVILPQALPPVVPALGNYVVAMFKDTPLLSTITVMELLFTAKNLGAETFRYLEPFTLVGLLFLIVSLAAAGGIRMLERRMPAYGA
jgi:polar amino acid transport system permease protein